MVSMSLTTRPASEPLTWRDLEEMPDDGRRRELVDGVLLVTPGPSWSHQTVVGELYAVLRAARTTGLQVLTAPLDVRLTDDTVLEPDLLVVEIAHMTQRGLVGRSPLLAVEVLSPSTRTIDLHVKRERLERAGCPAYWVVDPGEPALTAWELVEGRYVQAALVRGDEIWGATYPYSVEVCPARLIEPGP